VTRRTRRPAVGGGSAEVVSIGAGGTHRPDYARLASGQVAAGRHALGLSPGDFARYVNERTDWDAMPETITAWEDDELPPGDVVMIGLDAARGVAAPIPSLLAGIPPAFPAEALAGAWVTSYQFSHGGQPQHHADIARVTVLAGSQVRIVNHPPEPRSEGRGRSFRNEINASLAGRHLIGQWRNTSDTRYFGTLQLAVHPGETVMEGHYLGVGSDIQVSAGAWKWVRLDVAADDLAGVELRDPAEVYELVRSHSQYGGPLLLAEIREGA
jgi:hypothetical protein